MMTYRYVLANLFLDVVKVADLLVSSYRDVTVYDKFVNVICNKLIVSTIYCRTLNIFKQKDCNLTLWLILLTIYI